jgi:HAE1 family hydrophobic/amphiphilic exporter-1
MKNKNTIWEFFIQKYKFTILLLISFTIFGIISTIQLPKESNPEVDIPYAVVVTAYPGANAEDVEELITQPIEDKIKSLDEIDKLTSKSQNSISMITVQFDANSNAQEKINDLKNKVDLAKSDLPNDAEEPTVTQISLNDMPILTFSISGPYSDIEIKKYADILKDKIESISGISKVKILGGRNEQIKVVVDKAKLDSYGISLLQIGQAISAANSDIPIGNIESSNMTYTVRFAGRLQSVTNIEQIPLAKLANTPILLKDVANIYSDYTDIENISRLSKNGQSAISAISLSLYKTVGADTVRIVDQALETINTNKENLPNDINFDTSSNTGQDIQDNLSNLLINGLETMAIVIVLLFLFLGWREALLAGLSVPLTFLISFIFLQAYGYTLNFLTLFSLILSLGILVDNAIVIAEGIYVNMKKGMKVKEACITSVKEYQWTLAAGTLTTVFAFLPLITVSGIVGKFMVSIPVTISVVLLSSLFVAMAFIPTVASLIFKNDSNKKLFDDSNVLKQKKENWKDKMMNFITEKYDNIIINLLSHKNKSNKLLKYIAIALIFSFALPATGILKANMFPVGNEPKVYMDLKMPVGTPLEITNQQIKNIEEILLQDKNIKSFLVTVGLQTGGGGVDLGSGSTGNSHLAGIVINLKEKSKINSSDFIKNYDKILQEIGGIDFELTQDVMGPKSADPISISVKGEDPDVLDDISSKIKHLVENIPGTRSVRFTNEDTPGELIFEIDRVKAQMYGVTTAQIASLLRMSVAGIESTTIHKDGNEVGVLVKYDLDGQNDGISNKNIDLNNIESITILTSQGDIPISSFIKSDLSYAKSLIQHKDGYRIAEIIGDIEEGASTQTIFSEAKKQIKQLDIPNDYSIIYSGENEDMAEAFSDIFRALIIGIILIAGLLVLQFNSFKQPLFILITIPLALIGVLPGLVLMGQPLSFPAAIGVVALIGIVVKNAIILIEKININITNNLEFKEAIIEAGKSRLRPIILTTITTVVGMIPLAISDPTWGPLAYAIIFGLSFSTVLTLFVLPIIYYRLSNPANNENKQIEHN